MARFALNPARCRCTAWRSPGFRGVLLAAAALAATAGAQTSSAVANPQTGRQEKRPAASSSGLNRTAVVLDAAHGGADSGSRIGDTLLEKNITLALALKLRSLLIARGFEVTVTRDTDSLIEAGTPNTPLTLDERAGIANHAKASACLVFHATGRGNGVHVYTSQLDATPGAPAVAPWLTAQAAWVSASQQMERSISSALGRSHLALVSSTASVRPVDSLTCPALVIELAPQDNDVRSVADPNYQERVAQAIAGALVFWQNQVQPPARLDLTPAPARRSTRRHTTTPAEPAIP